MGDKYLAMYDIRGIQNYIFRTSKVKDAIGASAIVEDIITDALSNAVQEKKKGHPEMTVQLEWYDEMGPLEYSENDLWVQVLFIGGGNAYVLFKTEDLCKDINKLMSKYVLEHTYSLQLAIAKVKKSNNYSEDYTALQRKMVDAKAKMRMTKPLGCLPIMKTEISTGYPIVVQKSDGEAVSEETRLKKQISQKKQKQIDCEEKIFDNLIQNKGENSNLAIVHIDGNSMGIRIRQMVEHIDDYNKAIETMRLISYNINHSYKKVFEDMKASFEKMNEKKYIIRKIVTAGDDVTYVCNAQIALASVEYFANEISKYTMDGKTDDASILNYGFSVCAGVSFIHSHFPFHIGYDVAEELCSSAKERAKKKANSDNTRIGNFVDFHICHNVQAKDVKQMRKKEYITASGENLLIRPYYIHVDADDIIDSITPGNLHNNNNKYFAWNNFKKNILYFQNDNKMPRSFAKEIRNIYPLGKNKINEFADFLCSRGWKMPDGTLVMYDDSLKETNDTIAKWYDAVEMLDLYDSLEKALGKEEKNDSLSN